MHKHLLHRRKTIVIMLAKSGENVAMIKFHTTYKSLNQDGPRCDCPNSLNYSFS